jgi:hypothetical protein
MTRFILSIILCAGAAGAMAQNAAPRQDDAVHAHARTSAPTASSTEAQPKIVQAALVMPTQGQPMRGAGAPTAAQNAAAQVPGSEDEHPTLLMLLAALALMMGIAVRRWSLGDQ